MIELCGIARGRSLVRGRPQVFDLAAFSPGISDSNSIHSWCRMHSTIHSKRQSEGKAPCLLGFVKVIATRQTIFLSLHAMAETTVGHSTDLRLQHLLPMCSYNAIQDTPYLPTPIKTNRNHSL